MQYNVAESKISTTKQIKIRLKQVALSMQVETSS